jgi:hypothetical protein
MSKTAPEIVVAGDLCVDWLEVAVPRMTSNKDDYDMPLNWRQQLGTKMIALPGGALLLSELVGLAARTEIATHQLENLETIPPEEIIHSLVELDRFPYSSSKKDEENLIYRVKQLRGYSGPSEGLPKQVAINGDNPDAGIVVLNDAGNGFREVEEAWPEAIRVEGKQPTVILKMGFPLSKGRLWDFVRKAHPDRLIVIIGADDLRASGVNISRQISWERTAKDFVWQMACNPSLLALGNCAHLIVCFSTEGAIHYTRKEGKLESRLYYDPRTIEGEGHDGCLGNMIGITSAFVAALTARIAKDGLQGIGEGIQDGLYSSQRLFKQGFGRDLSQLKYPGAEIFQPLPEENLYFANVVVPNPTKSDSADPDYWCVLKTLSGIRLEEIAYDIVIKGDVDTLKNAPTGHFGFLTTIDRTEIESYRSIKNLMLEYKATFSPKRPLSVAVFGPPGSGKSFGVTKVAECIAPGLIEKLEFNVAQFVTPLDLISALHMVRDRVLLGKLPLVFFDEFDSSLESNPLAWLKFFLAPMQDGLFKDGETIHPVGKAIFVFAGGTSSTYEKFCRDGVNDEEFRNAKGPDFVSRLRGYINILGPNKVNDEDDFYMVRRATILRLQLHSKAPHLFESGRARVHEGVLRALLKIPNYKHGARSMEAIIDMSILSEALSFEQSSLPPKEQLQLHVDADTFLQLVVRDVLFGGVRDKIARAIHEKYCRKQKGKVPDTDPAMLTWEELSEDYKESNRKQADHIPEKLKRIGCGFTWVNHKPALIDFKPDEVELLAKMEHDRWVADKLLAGWTFGSGNSEKKTNLNIVGWDDLTDEVKEYNRQAVRGIPGLMAAAGFEIYRL